MTYDSDYYVGVDLNGDSLSHYGVPKQQWGVQHGPPYPIKRGKTVRYEVGKMSNKTKASLQKAGKIAKDKTNKVAKKVKSSFRNWKENKKMELATKDTNSKLLKNWQKKQLRISDMSNDELKQRIERKKLEAQYKNALRGDFRDLKEISKTSAGKNGKAASDSILKKIGNAAIDGLATGITNSISTKMKQNAEGKVKRRQDLLNTIAKVNTEAAKEREEYRAKEANESWKERKDRWNSSGQYRRDKWGQPAGDGAMDPLSGGNSSFRSNRQSNNYGSYYTPTNSTGLIRQNRSSSNYYYASPGSWTIR